MRTLLLSIVAVVASSTLALAAAGKGHPLIKPYQGSTLEEQSGQAFEEVTALVGRNGDEPKAQTLQGKTTHLQYNNPEGRSALEVSKNYEDALKAGGFDIVFSCSGGKDCPELCNIGILGCAHESFSRYLVAKLKRPAQGDVWVVTKSSDAQTYISIVEEKPMEIGLVTVDASALLKGIDADGHVAVYGIVFDTGKATLKPESDAQLTQIQKLLQQRAELKIHVVGHTDNVGNLSSNMDLSKRRADAVVQALVKRGIPTSRLNAAGVASLVPIATNDTDAGRARNRRVELVKQ